MRRWIALTGFAGLGALLVVLRPTVGQLQSHDWWAWLQRDPEHALLVVLSLIGWLLAAWLLLVTGLSLIAAAFPASGRVARCALRLIAPALVRRTLEGALGVALAVGPAGMAAAGPSTSAAPTQRSAVTQLVLTPVPAPIVAAPEASFLDLDRPPVSSPPSAPVPTPVPSAAPLAWPQTPTPPPSSADRHTVVTGDSLWSLAAAGLPDSATPAQITLAWQRWYAANRSTIGSDPALIFPGQELVASRASS